MIIAFDLGATNLRVAVVKGKSIINQIKVPTVKTGRDADLINQIIEQISLLGVPTFIGGAICGPVTEGGVVTALPQLSIGSIDLTNILSNHFNCPVVLYNDANAAALYEAKYGCGKGCRRVLYVTLSTGIGAGLVDRLKVVTGSRGNALEIGKMNNVGGELEDTCSGLALAEKYGDAALFFQRGGYDLQHWINILAIHLSNLIFIVDPDIMILGGGLLKSQETYFSSLQEKISLIINKDYPYDLPIVVSPDYEISPLLGAVVKTK